MFLNPTQKTKTCLVFHISILGSDQKYKIEKQAAGLILILIFNWSGLYDPEVWRYQRDAVTKIIHTLKKVKQS